MIGGPAGFNNAPVTRAVVITSALFTIVFGVQSRNRILAWSYKLNSGKVVGVGPGIHDREGKLIPVSVKEGDTVLLPEYGGTQVKLGEKEFHLYRDDDILGTLHD